MAKASGNSRVVRGRTSSKGIGKAAPSAETRSSGRQDMAPNSRVRAVVVHSSNTTDPRHGSSKTGKDNANQPRNNGNK